MTSLQLNSELFKVLSAISTDEGMVKKAVKAMKRILANHEKKAHDETEYIMSSPAMMEILRKGDEERKNGEGTIIKLEDLWK